MTSRSEMMPTIRESSTTGSAPIRFSPRRCTTSNIRASASMVSTWAPFPWSTFAIVMAFPFADSLGRLDSPTSRPQREGMPIPDPVPSPRHATMRRFWRILRLLAVLSIVIAAIAVFIVARGPPALHVHMLGATALGVGLTVLLGTGLMTLVFLSSSSGHDEEATTRHRKSEDE